MGSGAEGHVHEMAVGPRAWCGRGVWWCAGGRRGGVSEWEWAAEGRRGGYSVGLHVGIDLVAKDARALVRGVDA